MSDLKKTAAHGIKGDRLLGHLTPGDAIMPAEAMAHPPTAAAVHSIYAAHGLPPGRFIAGHPGNSRNPTTGLRQFEGPSSGGGDGPDGDGPDHSDEGGRAMGAGARGPGTGAAAPGSLGGIGENAPGATQGPTRGYSVTAGDVLTGAMPFGSLVLAGTRAAGISNPGDAALNALGLNGTLASWGGDPIGTPSAFGGFSMSPPGPNPGAARGDGAGSGAYGYMPPVDNQSSAQIASAAPGLVTPPAGPPGPLNVPIPPAFGSTVPLDANRFLQAWQARQQGSGMPSGMPPQSYGPPAAFGIPQISPDILAQIRARFG